MRLFLAPMEGVTDHHFRSVFTAIGGVDLCVTEFVRVNDLPLTPRLLRRECPELPGLGRAPGETARTPAGIPVRVQLLGSNPETLAESAQLAVAMGAPAVDLNFGCPAKTVNNSKGGSILLKEPALVAAIVAAVRGAVPATVPVTAKIRLGFEDRSLYMDNALAIAGAGASELIVHARSRMDGYRPPAYWTCIRDIVERLSIPVVANGEIWSVADWRRCQAESGCRDFMLGRGLVACPDLALQLRAEVNGCAYEPLSWQAVLSHLHRFYLGTRDVYPPRFLGNRVKQWLFYLQMHYPEAVTFFEQIKRFKRPEAFEEAFAMTAGNPFACAQPLPLATLAPPQRHPEATL